MAKLTDLKIKSLSEPKRYADGNGLNLRVAPGGSKSWVQRIIIDRKRCGIGLGVCPTVSLRKSREKAAYNRIEVEAERDPRKPKQIRKVVTFQETAKEYYDLIHNDWSSDQFKRSWWGSPWSYRHPLPLAKCKSTKSKAPTFAMLGTPFQSGAKEQD